MFTIEELSKLSVKELTDIQNALQSLAHNLGINQMYVAQILSFRKKGY